MLCPGTRLVYDSARKSLIHGTCPKANYQQTALAKRMGELGYSQEDIQMVKELRSQPPAPTPPALRQTPGAQLIRGSRASFLSLLLPALLKGEDIPCLNLSVFYASIMVADLSMAEAIDRMLGECERFTLTLSVEDCRNLHLYKTIPAMSTGLPPTVELARTLGTYALIKTMYVFQPAESVYSLNDESIWGFRPEYSPGVPTNWLKGMSVGSLS